MYIYEVITRDLPALITSFMEFDGNQVVALFPAEVTLNSTKLT